MGDQGPQEAGIQAEQQGVDFVLLRAGFILHRHLVMVRELVCLQGPES